jgi:hypothetical protein
LNIQKQNIFDYISKADYEAIMNKQPSQMQRMMEEQKMAMEAKNTAMQSLAAGEGGAPTSEMMSPGQEMSPAGTNPMQPENPNEVPRPQSPMMGAVDASLGRASNLPFFPGQ